MDALEVIVSEIDKKLVQLQDAVGTGRCANFEEYKGMCGEIKGLFTARGYVLDVRKRLEQAEDE